MTRAPTTPTTLAHAGGASPSPRFAFSLDPGAQRPFRSTGCRDRRARARAQSTTGPGSRRRGAGHAEHYGKLVLEFTRGAPSLGLMDRLDALGATLSGSLHRVGVTAWDMLSATASGSSAWGCSLRRVILAAGLGQGTSTSCRRRAPRTEVSVDWSWARRVRSITPIITTAPSRRSIRTAIRDLPGGVDCAELALRALLVVGQAADE